MTIDQLISLIRTPETKDKGSMILNDIIHEWYDMHLVTCPQCSAIHSFLPESEEVHTCGICNSTFTQDEAPDLFFF